jgi:tRNA(Ile)-lysidine synthase
MPSPHSFEQRLAEAWPATLWQDVGVLLAVSGGADSVALLRAMRVLKTGGAGRLAAAHFNHRLRGVESDSDQQFVVSLCKTRGLDCVVSEARAADLLACGDGLEAAARQARYDFLQRTAETLGARYVVTAHTADDQVETILHHVVRGTGLCGLAGMQPARMLGPAVTLVRPMLRMGRDLVLGYLASLDQPYREDQTNRDLRHTRNRIRHELLPLLKRDYSATVAESLLRLGSLASDATRVVDALVGQLLERAVRETGASYVTLDCGELAGQDRHLVRELLIAVWRRQAWPLQAMGYTQWDALAGLALAPQTPNSQGSKQVFPGAITAERRGGQLVLASSEDA